MFVYGIVNSETLKIYIGQHKGTNLRQYLQQKLSEARRGFSGKSHLYASMRKHPRESWSIHSLISGIQTREECDYWEKVLIKSLNAQHPEIGYNICRGGEGYTGPGAWLGKTRSQETKDKIRDSKLGCAPNSGSFQAGFVPWNAGKKTGQVVWNKDKKMQYTSEDSRQRAIKNLEHGWPKGKPFSVDHKMAIKKAHETCSCPRHIAARNSLPISDEERRAKRTEKQRIYRAKTKSC
jgi:hypothetical protein